MLFRVLEYEVQIYKSQIRDWAKQHASLAGFRLQPVLPVVFYTGLRPWDGLGTLTDLMELGEQFRRRTPQLEPLFINLAALPPVQLEEEGGFFGWVLAVDPGAAGAAEGFPLLAPAGGRASGGDAGWRAVALAGTAVVY